MLGVPVVLATLARARFGAAQPLAGAAPPWSWSFGDVEAGLSEPLTDQTVIDGGTSSRVALGVFYEGIRAWQLSMGPYVGFDTTFSQSAVVPVAAIGWRTALYAGPLKEEEAEPPKQAATRW